MPQSAYLHEGLDFPEYFEAGDDHGFGWLDRRALWRRTILLQSVMLSLCVHIAVISIFAFGPGNAESVRSPWLEVRLVSLGSDEVAAGSGQEGGSGGSPAAAYPVPENPPVPEVLSPDPVPPVVEKVQEREPKSSVSLATAQPRPASKPKQLAKVPAVQREPCDSEASSAFSSQPADAAASQSSGAGSSHVPAESGEGGSGAAHGKGTHLGHGGGPVDAEFGAANGPRFAHKSMPHYPRLARQLGREATVVLRVTIDERGRPIAVEAVKTAGSGFDEEAIRAVKESFFHPAKREGRPVICRAILPIRFELRGSE